MDYALSSDDLRKICPDLKVLTYPQLTSYGSLEELFGQDDRPVALLYETSPYYGHWTCLIKHGPGQYEFFDPYALPPDSELFFIDDAYRRESNQEHHHLLNMILDAGGTTIWSMKQVQKDSPNISTCGRWIALRCLARNMPLDMFRRMFGGAEWTPDRLVVGLSDMFLKR